MRQASADSGYECYSVSKRRTRQGAEQGEELDQSSSLTVNGDPHSYLLLGGPISTLFKTSSIAAFNFISKLSGQSCPRSGSTTNRPSRLFYTSTRKVKDDWPAETCRLV